MNFMDFSESLDSLKSADFRDSWDSWGARGGSWGARKGGSGNPAQISGDLGDLGFLDLYLPQKPSSKCLLRYTPPKTRKTEGAQVSRIGELLNTIEKCSFSWFSAGGRFGTPLDTSKSRKSMVLVEIMVLGGIAGFGAHSWIWCL